MSVVTSVVVVAPGDWSDDQIQRLGTAMYRAHAEARGADPDEDHWYQPVPASVGGLYLSDGGKTPGGTLWWLGLNHSDMGAFTAALDPVEEFHGVWVWWQHEYKDEVRTHRVGG